MWSESEIYGAIARGWCDERNSGKEMDVDLADAIAIEVLAVVRSRIATLERQVEQARETEQRLGDYCQTQCGTRGECCRAHGLDLSCAICAALDGGGK
jgi:hypothetical protein